MLQCVLPLCLEYLASVTSIFHWLIIIKPLKLKPDISVNLEFLLTSFIWAQWPSQFCSPAVPYSSLFLGLLHVIDTDRKIDWTPGSGLRVGSRSGHWGDEKLSRAIARQPQVPWMELHCPGNRAHVPPTLGNIAAEGSSYTEHTQS